MTPFARLLIIGLVSFASTAAPATELPAAARSEIDARLHALGSSGCEFLRNGDWYDAATAERHLARKFEAIDRKHLLASADQFIDIAASRSSMSGKTYQVRCPGGTPEPSADWLARKLAQIRANAANAANAAKH